jgi:hypothetical protein
MPSAESDGGGADASAVADGRGAVDRAGAGLAARLAAAAELRQEVARLCARRATAAAAAAATAQRVEQAAAAAVVRAAREQERVLWLSAALSAAQKDSDAAAAAAAAVQRRLSTLAPAGRRSVGVGGEDAAGAGAAEAPTPGSPVAVEPAGAAPGAVRVPAPPARAGPTLANAPLPAPTLPARAAYSTASAAVQGAGPADSAVLGLQASHRLARGVKAEPGREDSDESQAAAAQRPPADGRRAPAWMGAGPTGGLDDPICVE